jgi:hypothetical protein
MGDVATAQRHLDRAAIVCRHAERARTAETREMYLRLARTEAALAEMAEHRHQTEMVASGERTLPIPQDRKKPNGEG